MPDRFNVFLSYSRNDPEAAAGLRAQLERQGLSVFRDEDSIREGDRWLEKLQGAVERCGAFVVLVGQDGVRRWVGAETQVALVRHFGPEDRQREQGVGSQGDISGSETEVGRLPIFPILLGDTGPESLPAFLGLFQATRWNGSDILPSRLLDAIRDKATLPNDTARFDGCPYVGLASYDVDQAGLFFGRQRDTLDALACFDRPPGKPPVRWLEISGNSGAGKSSLMNAGILPLVDQGWLWARTGIETFQRIGPLTPGKQPVRNLCVSLARAFRPAERLEAADVARYLRGDDEHALADWLRMRTPNKSGFLLAIDQFEELFSLADRDERETFDRLLAGALNDPDCHLYVISTVRADFHDRFDELPRLAALRPRLGKLWPLPQIGADDLREVIDGPARLAGLDVSEVREAMVQEARDEPGALPLVEHALSYLWRQRDDGDRLSGRLLSEEGGLAGILSKSADDLLDSLDQRETPRAKDLLFQMVQLDPAGQRHTRRRIPLAEAVEVAGGGDRGRDLIDRLSGARGSGVEGHSGSLRLVTVTDEGTGDGENSQGGSFVNLIHETLIRSKGIDDQGKPQPYWPTLWEHIERNKGRAVRRQRLSLMAREWSERRGLARLFGLAGWASLFGFRGLAAPGSPERRYLRWSRGRALGEILGIGLVLAILLESLVWLSTREQDFPISYIPMRWAVIAGMAPTPKLESIRPGTFLMGGSRREELPRREVDIDDPFEIGATEVTFREWDAFVLDHHCETLGYSCNTAYPNSSGWGRGTQPVIDVSWDDVQTYLDWLSETTGKRCRLPSEAEWEYAARAGTAMKYALPAPAGSDDIANIPGQILANCLDCGSKWDAQQTAPVGSFAPNAWGLHDMHGNVWEWVADCWHDSYEDAPFDGSAREGEERCSRVLRGGSWDFSQDYARSATRGRDLPDFRYFYFGFRVLCSSPSLGSGS